MTSDHARSRFFSAFLCAAFVLLAVALGAWSIVPHDTDLWYHLNFGTRIAATGQLPTDASWYSYVKTQPGFADYYWLTQLLFYAVHRLFGFTGLIALRAVLVLATAAAIAGLLARSELARTSRAWAFAIGGLALLVILERVATVRPHMFSYLGLATCLWLAERGGRAAYGLIPVALLWSNLHGIEYPVLALVLGGVIADRAWQRGKGDSSRAAVAAALALGCVLATPAGTHLIAVPFSALGLVGQQIFELRPVSVSDLATFGVRCLIPDSGAIRALLLGLSLFALLDSARRRSCRVRHLVWLAGGAFLLLRAERFASEFALLALPTLGASRGLGEFRLPLPGRVPGALVSAALAALALARVLEITHGPFPYPTADAFLPKGTSAFLKAHARHGRVLHHPNYGGYLQWSLGRAFRIGADLQTPFLFSPEQVLAQSSAYAGPDAMRAALRTWSPDFVFVPWNGHARIEAALASDFAAVAFDDNAVLYAHRQRQAQLAASFELRALSPAKFNALLHHAFPGDEVEAARTELTRLLAVERNIAFTRAALALLDEQQHRLPSALQHARAAVALAPGHVDVLRVAADVALAAQQWTDALRYCEAGLNQLARGGAPPQTRTALAFGTARALAALGREDEVYARLSTFFGDMTDASVSAGDLRLLAAAAGDAGERDMARTLAALANQRSSVPSPDPLSEALRLP